MPLQSSSSLLYFQVVVFRENVVLFSTPHLPSLESLQRHIWPRRTYNATSFSSQVGPAFVA
ncbi:hypothetical protein CCHR01_15727 [Colletotrichum chrysophilum]|uniref:Uncharacterized protein n=1 Tax=Colletotrichum chrysophilum TaxID=1836956 RepID=A0AAD9A5Q9_9PEZI|nr:hypothetical protein CCHR01_15727 [Colletotrichum chrysophilum]